MMFRPWQQWELRQSDLDCSPEYFNCVLLSRLALCIFIAIIFCRVTFVILSFVSFRCLSGFYVGLSSLFEFRPGFGDNVIRFCEHNFKYFIIEVMILLFFFSF